MKNKTQYIVGIVDMKSTGKAYVISDECTEDIKIQANNTNKALNGDKVRVYILPERKNMKLEGEITEILERAKNKYVGIIQVSDRFAFLVPDSQSMPIDIFIPLENLNEAKDGDKVVVELIEWPEHAKNPFGKVIEVLGTPGDNNVEMNSILAEFNFEIDFPKEAEDEANAIPREIPQEEIAKRRDFRNTYTITIDPTNAKDFDDALSVKQIKDGMFEIGIHIADVSHYVKPGSEIEKEAYKRATSVYLVDRTIPMLPERLSNEICSLRPDEDKLCFSAVFEMDENARIHKEWYGKTIIRSDRRFTYSGAQKIIETNLPETPNQAEWAVITLHRLACKMRLERVKRGAIIFDRGSEVRFVLDKAGKPTGTYTVEQKESNMLVEDFMLLANRKVAELAGKNKKLIPFVYRIHDEPNQDKLKSLSEVASKLGYVLRTGSRKAIAESLNQLLKNVEGKGEQSMIETLAMRCMSKAIYTTSNIGHYGLAFKHYTHFTSPIRRYPDLMVHRLLAEYLDNNLGQADENACKHASDMEKKAADAERASVKYKQVEFLTDKIGQVFDGQISGVSKWGLFVEILENKCEGMVRLADIDDDFYYLDEDTYSVIGQNYGKTFKLGDKVKIRIKKANLSRKQLDYIII